MVVDCCINVFTNLSNSDLDESTTDLTRRDDINEGDLQALALKDLTLSLKPGEKFAICGRSGRYINLSFSLANTN